jgi:hypothetical protein
MRHLSDKPTRTKPLTRRTLRVLTLKDCFRYPTNGDRIPNVMIAPFSLANLRLIQIEDLLSMQQVRLLSP